MILALLKWWYGRGLAQVFGNLKVWPRRALRNFSIPLLIRTLFAPWKRIISDSGKGLDAKVRAAVDNIISRFVGMTVRSIVLLTAGFLFVMSFVAAVAAAIAWPLMPLAVIFLIIKGITG